MNPYRPPHDDRPQEQPTRPDSRPAWRVALAIVLLICAVSLLFSDGAGLGPSVIIAAGALASYGRGPRRKRD